MSKSILTAAQKKDLIWQNAKRFLVSFQEHPEYNKGRRKENWIKSIYVIFDVIKFEGELITNKSLIERKKYLERETN